MNKLKKTLALLLSLVMVLGLLPAMALADDAELPEEVSEMVKEEALGSVETRVITDVDSAEAGYWKSAQNPSEYLEYPEDHEPYYEPPEGYTNLTSGKFFIAKFSKDDISKYPSGNHANSFSIQFTANQNISGYIGTCAYASDMASANNIWTPVLHIGAFPDFSIELSKDTPKNTGHQIYAPNMFSGDDDYFLVGFYATSSVTENTTVTVQLYSEDGTISFSGDPISYTIQADAPVAANVARIERENETEYFTTLEAAFAAAQDGQTITLLADCTGNGIKVPQGKFTNGLTVDFNNHTYTVNANTVGSTGTETNGFQLLKDNKITFKDGTITSTEAKILVQNYSNLTLDNMTLTLNNTSYTGAYTLSNNNGNVVIDDTTINANPAGGFAFDVCRYSSYRSVNVTVTGNSTINGNVEIFASGSDAKDGFSLTLESGTMSGDIVVTNSAAAAMETAPDKVSITKAAAFTATAPEGYKWDDDDKLVEATFVARIDSTQYETLAAAIAAVPTDGTQTIITMIGDETIVGNAGVTVAAGKNIVLDLNGHTIKNAVNEQKASQVITNKGMLTIRDTAGNGKIANAVDDEANSGDWWSNPQKNFATNVFVNSGTLTIDSGTIEQTGKTSITYAVDNNSTTGNAVLNVNGGTLTAKGTVVRMFCNSITNENTVNVSGGEISTTGTTAIWIQLPGGDATKNVKATLNVTDGTLKGGTYAFYDHSSGNSFGATQYTLSGGTFDGVVFSYGANIAISGGTYKGDVAIKQAKAASNVSVSGGQFDGDVYTYGNYASNGFITGGIFAINTYEDEGTTYACDWLDCIANGYVAVANTNEATKTAYPWAVKQKVTVAESENLTVSTEEGIATVSVNDVEQTTVTVTVADETTVQAVTSAVAAEVPNVATSLNVAKVVEKAVKDSIVIKGENTIEILVKAVAAREVPNVDVPTGAKVVEVDPYAIVNGDTDNPIALTNEDLGSNPSFTFKVALGKTFANKVVTLKHYSDEGKLKNTFKGVSTDAEGNATVTLTSFSYLIGEVAYQVSDATGNYLQTTNADIRSSLLWNVYFHIDSIADPVNNAYILVSSRYDEEIDGKTYRLTYDSKRSAYMITVPIRPRLIDQNVGFTLISNGTVYPMTYGSAGANLYNELDWSFSNYLTSIDSVEDAKVVTGLQAWRDVLKDRWPIVANY